MNVVRKHMANRGLRWLCLAILAPLLALIWLVGGQPSSVAAQSGGLPTGLQWQPPRPVPGYDVEAMSPYLIADQNHTIHAFNSTRAGNRRVIVYSQWTQETGWSSPVDILLSPLKLEARLRGAVLDERGFVHLVFFGGDDLGASIFHAKAPLAQAGNAQAWTKPALIGDDAIAPTNAALATDGQGNLYMIYSGAREGVGLYANYSTDNGDFWQEPVTVFRVEDDEHWPNALRLHLDEQGKLHATWTLVNRSGNGEAIFYSQMDAATRTWSTPLVLATRDPGDYEADWPTLTSHDGLLILMYQDSFPATRWMRTSNDGGLSWTNPVRPFNYVGEYRHVAFAADSNGFLHMFMGNRTEDAVHGMWHSVWMGDRWSELEPVVAGPRITEGAMDQHFDPTGPEAVISNGNLLMVVWFTDPGAGQNGVWYSTARVDAPELPAQPLPLPTPMPSPTPLGPQPSSRQAATPAASVTSEAADPGQAESNPALIVSAALIPTMLLIGGVIYWQRRRSHYRD